MERQLDDSDRTARESFSYDDVVADSNSTSKESIVTPEDVDQNRVCSDTKINDPSVNDLTQESTPELLRQKENITLTGAKNEDDKVGKELQQVDASCTENTVDNEALEYKRRLRRGSNDKELWTPVKTDEGDRVRVAHDAVEDSTGNHPTKPPRRHPQKKKELKEKNGALSAEDEQKTSSVSSSEDDPVKPPRRRLPQTPTPGAVLKPNISDKAEVDSVFSDDQLSASGDHSEENPREIVCKPVLTSSPNQDEIPSLAVEMVDTLDTSRRVLSYLDVSSGGGTTKRVESFYDFLYSRDDISSVVNVTSPVLQERDRASRTHSSSEEHLYDDVPMEDSIAESFGSKKSLSGSAYEEVIVNRGVNK